jgi:DNA polymerase III epsilon subunit-like protein
VIGGEGLRGWTQAVAVHGIDEAEVRDAPSFAEIEPDLNREP